MNTILTEAEIKSIIKEYGSKSDECCREIEKAVLAKLVGPTFPAPEKQIDNGNAPFQTTLEFMEEVRATLRTIKPGWDRASSSESLKDAAVRTIRELARRDDINNDAMRAIYKTLDDLDPDWEGEGGNRTATGACNAIRDLARRANAKMPKTAAPFPDFRRWWEEVKTVLDITSPGWSKDKIKSPGYLAVQAIKELAREANEKQNGNGFSESQADRIFAALDQAIPNWQIKVLKQLAGKS